MNIYQIISTILLSLFYIIYFINILIKKIKKINFYSLGFKKEFKKTRTIEILLIIFCILTFTTQIYSIIINENTYIIIFPDWVRICAFIIMALGILMLLLSIITMKDNFRIGINEKEEIKLINYGIYSFSRNPYYLGFYLFYIGLMIVFPNVFNIIIPFIAILMMSKEIKQEEGFLFEKLNDTYIEYKNKVNRYITLFKKKNKTK